MLLRNPELSTFWAKKVGESMLPAAVEEEGKAARADSSLGARTSFSSGFLDGYSAPCDRNDLTECPQMTSSLWHGSTLLPRAKSVQEKVPASVAPFAVVTRVHRAILFPSFPIFALFLLS